MHIMSELRKVIKTIFTPVRPPTIPPALMLPDDYPDLEPYEAITRIATDWKTKCPGPYQGKACDSTNCNYRIQGASPPENCSFWLALKAELGKFDPNEALVVYARLQLEFLTRATRIEAFMTKYLTKRSMIELLLAQQLAWFVLQVMLLNINGGMP